MPETENDGLKLTLTPTFLQVDLSTLELRQQQWLDRFLRFNLAVWEQIGPRVVLRGKYYDLDPYTQTLRLPSSYQEQFCGYLDSEKLDYHLYEPEVIPGAPLCCQLPEDFVPKNDDQREVIQYLSEHSLERKAVAAQTGFGKTVCAIAGAVGYGERTLIIAPANVIEQWRQAILKFSTAKADQICVLQGYDSIRKLLKHPDRYDWLLCSIRTLVQWAQRATEPYRLIPLVERTLYQEVKIGTRIIDETHLNFEAVVCLDLHSICAHNIYMSATFVRSDAHENRIFSRIFPKDMRFMEDKFDKYIDVVDITYHGGVPTVAVDFDPVRNSKGYNHFKYENYLLKRPLLLEQWFHEVILPTLKRYYLLLRRPGERVLIFVAEIDMAQALKHYLEEQLPQEQIIAYVGDMTQEQLEGQQIIISTPGKTGTGTDIKQLRTVICTVSQRSVANINQFRGRLRKLQDVTPIYCELTDVNVISHLRHTAARRIQHCRYAKSYTVVDSQEL